MWGIIQLGGCSGGGGVQVGEGAKGQTLREFKGSRESDVGGGGGGSLTEFFCNLSLGFEMD